VAEVQQILSIQIPENREGATIEFLPASGCSGSIRLTLDQLTSLIQVLGRVREQMVVGRPVPPLEGARVQPVLHTHWYVQPEPLSEGSLFTFYHPAFGPVGLVIARDQVPDIIHILTAHLGIRPSAGRPN
jgi:hypothetical protein